MNIYNILLMNGALRGSLWLVVRINQLGLQVEFKSLVNLDFFGSQLHEEVLTALDEGS